MLNGRTRSNRAWISRRSARASISGSGNNDPASVSTLAFEAYGEKELTERHRHRYEFNNAYLERLSNKGLVVSGVCPQGSLVEMIELKRHPWFVGCQFHPEFRSRPHQPHPLFSRFLGAACESQARSSWSQRKEEAQPVARGTARTSKVKLKKNP